jgi:hypothetical protein
LTGEGAAAPFNGLHILDETETRPAGGLIPWKKCVSAQKEKYCPKKSVQNSQGGGQFEMCKLVKYSNIEDKMK